MDDFINPLSGLWGKKRLQNKNPNREQEIKDLFEENEGFINAIPALKRFQRRVILAKKINLIWQADLADVTKYADENDGTKFILVCIDVLSRYARVEPLKNKTNPEVKSAFEKIFKKAKPSRIQTDEGKEFLGNTVQAMFRREHIYHYVVYSDVKAALAERFNRTLKMLISKYQDTHNTLRYIDVLQDLVKNYNNTIHRTIKIEPTEVNEQNSAEVYQRLLDRVPTKIKEPKFQVGDYVKISRTKNVFEKETTGNFTKEIFKVSRVKPTNPITYSLEDLADEPMLGSFYSQELTKVREPTEFVIDKILQERYVGRGRNRYKEVLVKWLGYPDKFNSWEKESEVHDI